MAYNRLQLCQRFAQEAELSGAANGTVPASTIGQSGEMLQAVRDIDASYEELQSMKPNWHFLRFDFSFQTTATIASYTPVDVSLPELKTWKRDSFRFYLTSVGTTDEQYLPFMPWEMFRDAYLLGPSRDNTGPPMHFTVKPDKSLMFWPIPDATYTITGEYWKRPQAMTANADEPLMPDEFHLILVWMACMRHGRRQSAPEVYGLGKEEFEKLFGPLKTNQLPTPQLAGPML